MCLYLGVWVGDILIPKQEHVALEPPLLLLDEPLRISDDATSRKEPLEVPDDDRTHDSDLLCEVAHTTGLICLWFSSLRTLLHVYVPWGDTEFEIKTTMNPSAQIGLKEPLESELHRKLRHQLMIMTLSNLCPLELTGISCAWRPELLRRNQGEQLEDPLSEFDVLAWVIWGRAEPCGPAQDTSKFRAPIPHPDQGGGNLGLDYGRREIRVPSEHTDPYFSCIPHMSTGGFVSQIFCEHCPVAPRPTSCARLPTPSSGGIILTSIMAFLLATGIENHDLAFECPDITVEDFLHATTVWSFAFAWTLFYTRMQTLLVDPVDLQRWGELRAIQTSCIHATSPAFLMQEHADVNHRYGVGGKLRPRRPPDALKPAASDSRRKRVTFSDSSHASQQTVDKIVTAPGCLERVVDLERLRTELVLDKLASSSRKIFDNQLQFWFIYCRVRNRLPVWRDNSPSLERENFVLDYVVQTGVIDRKAPATVKVRLAAIRSHHLALGLPDPFFHMPRLTMALAGLSRRYGRPERRLPVTTQMLAWLKIRLDPYKHPYQAIVWAALALGFFFLLRASEYLKPSHPSQTNRGLLGRHVLLCFKGEPVSQRNFRKADELKVEIQGSKTDIYNRGEHRNHFASHIVSHGARLCVVEAMIILCSHFPDRFFGTARDDYLLRGLDGDLIPREEVQAILQIAAEKTGAEPGEYGTHSLRFGGASALWAAFHDTGLVKRWGRWATDCFHTYLWEDRKGAEGIAEAMAASDVTPT